jgi:hypothetical protein
MPSQNENILYGIIAFLFIGLLIFIYLYFSKNSQQNPSICPTSTCPSANFFSSTSPCPTCPSETNIIFPTEILFKNKAFVSNLLNKYIQINEGQNVFLGDMTCTPIDLEVSDSMDPKFIIYKIKLNGKYITIQPIPNGNVITPGQHFISLTDKFFYNDKSNLTPGSTPTASLFYNLKTNKLYAFFTSEASYEAFYSDVDNFVVFNNNDLEQNVHNLPLSIENALTEPVLQNKFIFIEESLNSYLGFPENKEITINPFTLREDSISIDMTSFCNNISKLLKNGKYISVQAVTRFDNLKFAGGHVIRLTDKFYYNDASNLIPGSIPTASLFLNNNNNLCAYFTPQNQYTVWQDPINKNNIVFSSSQAIKIEIKDN